MAAETVREMTATFQSAESLEAAVNELTTHGWDRADLSMLAQRDLLDDKPVAEHAAVVSDSDIRQTRTMAAGMAGVVAAFVASGATIMTGGAVAVAVIGAAVAGGGAAAAVEALGLTADKKHDDFLQRQLDAGGIVLWITLREPDDEAKARAIVARCGGGEIRVAELPVSSANAEGRPA
ncbi:MAG: hypothetical protein AB7K86_17590 [Rhodospirillales bacterium]